jgi:hypothetical protein
LGNSCARVVIDPVKREPGFKAGYYLISFHWALPLRHETGAET